jgi:hypothetical protein
MQPLGVQGRLSFYETDNYNMITEVVDLLRQKIMRQKPLRVRPDSV